MATDRRRGFGLAIVLVLAWASAIGPSIAAAECPTESWLERSESGADGIGGSGVGGDTPDGIGGSGHAPSRGDEDGIGGSGVTPLAQEEGIGGSGVAGEDGDGIGDAGFFGTVTGFGSLCVNGARVEYDASARVRIDGVETTADALRVGQVVRVAARALQGGDLVALRIEIIQAVVGSVTAIEAVGRNGIQHIEVSGQPVVLETPDVAIGAFSVGDRVAVSGLRRGDGAVVASRIEAPFAGVVDGVREVDPLGFGAGIERVDVEGYVERRSDGRLAVGGIVLEGRAADPFVAGERVRVRAAIRPDAPPRPLRAERLRERPLLRGLDRGLRPPPPRPRSEGLDRRPPLGGRGTARAPRPEGSPGGADGADGRSLGTAGPSGANATRETRPGAVRPPQRGPRAVRPVPPPRPPPIFDASRPKRPPSDVRPLAPPPPPPPPPGM